MLPNKKNILYMLKESNAIENIYDEQSLDDAYQAWKYLSRKKTLTIESVLKCHQILMDNQPIQQKHKGDFRDAPVRIGYKLKTLPKPVIKSLVIDLLNDINSPENDNPENALMHHVQFEEIHPFIDGNGRLGRIILNWELVKHFKSNLLVFKDVEKYDTYYKLFEN